MTIIPGLTAAVAGYGHKAAAFLHAQIWLLGQQSLPGRPVPRLQISMECARKNPHTFFSLRLVRFFNLNLFVITANLITMFCLF